MDSERFECKAAASEKLCFDENVVRVVQGRSAVDKRASVLQGD